MGTSWKRLVMVVLLGGATAWTSAQQPASTPAANHAPVSPVVQTAQPFSDIVSENVFNLQRRDLAKEAQDQATRRVTQPGNNASVWHKMNSGQVHYTSVPGLEADMLTQCTRQKWWLFHDGVITVQGGQLIVLVPPTILTFFL